MTARWARPRLRAAARSILREALLAADPHRLVSRHLKVRSGALEAAGVRHPLGRGRVAVVAVGKAAVPMARAAEEALGERLAVGIAVSTASGGGLAATRLLTASHPVPDARGLAAATEVEALARGLGRDDLLLVLLSGGASALLPFPAEGLALEDKARTTALLLRAGATIQGKLRARRAVTDLPVRGTIQRVKERRFQLCFPRLAVRRAPCLRSRPK